MRVETESNTRGNYYNLLFIMIISVFLVEGCIGYRASFRPGGADPYAQADQAGTYQQLELDGKTIGNAKVWSRGIQQYSEDSTQVMHVGLRIKNDAQDELVLDIEKTELEIQTQDGQILVTKTVAEMVGSNRVLSGMRARIELLYALPENFKPDDINTFELNWVVELNQRQLSMSTPFFRDPRHRRVYVAAPYWSAWYPWYPFWLSFPGWFHPGWAFSYNYFFNPWYLYPSYRYYRYSRPRYYNRTVTTRPVYYSKPRHRYSPRRAPRRKK